MGREEGLEKVLKAHDVDIVIGPIDSSISSMATAGGKIMSYPDIQ